MAARVSAGVSLPAALLLALTPAAVPASPAAPRTSSVERISTTVDGTQPNGASADAVISDDGRYAAVLSRAENLGCAEAFPCMLVKDLATGAVTAVTEGGGFWWGPPSISGTADPSATRPAAACPPPTSTTAGPGTPSGSGRPPALGRRTGRGVVGQPARHPHRVCARQPGGFRRSR
ncbi:hypothetical protein [Streptomyces sp. NPDC002573]|uniref:hypothetical protein n=1 Tax=Streptomyces sp. NPDC002573 TaxID=3364651 RepID=UPI00367DFEDE